MAPASLNMRPHDIEASVAVPAAERRVAAPIAWELRIAAVAATLMVFGFHWDISWHRSIGRDSFWSPPHVAVYLGGVLAGAVSAVAILGATLSRNPGRRDATVRVWGLRGPLGAFVIGWGCLAMLTSAPFDNWWHNAYGLDVTLLSLPHVALVTGIVAVTIGVLAMSISELNRQADLTRTSLQWLVLYLGALIVVELLLEAMEGVARVYMHSAAFYAGVAAAVPFLLAAIARATGHRWASTAVTGLYTASLLLFVWGLPLFPASPGIAPVYFPVTHFVPMEFPLLLIVPAVALDLLNARTSRWRDPVRAAIGGAAFLALFAAAQWPFATFLMSPASRNRLFGTAYVAFSTDPGSSYAHNVFRQVERTPAEFWALAALALVAAIVSTRLGMIWGDHLQRIRR